MTELRIAARVVITRALTALRAARLLLLTSYLLTSSSRRLVTLSNDRRSRPTRVISSSQTQTKFAMSYRTLHRTFEQNPELPRA